MTAYDVGRGIHTGGSVASFGYPDWAVLVERDGDQRLYFVVESKGSLFTDVLRPAEKAKIDCGREHFRALNAEVEFRVETDFGGFSSTFS